MVCDDCGRVEEIHLCALPAPLPDIAAKNGFTPVRWNLELHGCCRTCAA
jgi:Fe2+ or Zn2+ uptake regulation protein